MTREDRFMASMGLWWALSIVVASQWHRFHLSHSVVLQAVASGFLLLVSWTITSFVEERMTR